MSVLREFALNITGACSFKAAISLSQTLPNSFSPSSSIQSGIDSLIFLILLNSSKRPFIRRVGVGSICGQSGKLIPLSTHQTAKSLKRFSLEKGSLTSAISA